MVGNHLLGRSEFVWCREQTAGYLSNHFAAAGGITPPPTEALETPSGFYKKRGSGATTIKIQFIAKRAARSIRCDPAKLCVVWKHDNERCGKNRVNHAGNELVDVSLEAQPMRTVCKSIEVLNRNPCASKLFGSHRSFYYC